jgi:hypothetical protein
VYFWQKGWGDMGIKLAILALFLFISQLAMGQAAPSEITNADVISMTKAGIGEQTIILAIQRGPVKFDTSPQALITLKTAGVSDQVLDAILVTVNSKEKTGTEINSVNAAALLQKALNAMGPREKIAAIQSFRWTANVDQHTQGRTISFERETVRVYPDRVYTGVKAATRPLQKQVITPEFNYRNAGTMIVAVPPADLDNIRAGFQFEWTYIAQHADDYSVSVVGDKHGDNTDIERLKISKLGKDVIWDIDSHTGRLLSATLSSASGDVVTEYSDWRLVDGVYFPFKRHTTDSSSVTDFTVTDFEVNPTIDEHLFQPPAQSPSQSLTLTVLQSQSVPYIQESGGGISTSCNIVGAANTSAYANTVGTNTFGNATTNSTQQMSCNSYDTTVRWPHVLNVMFAEASDGNSYMFACDAAWRWSKCVPLQAGQVFNARFTNKGLEVEAFNTKGKEENPTYRILQSKSLH